MPELNESNIISLDYLKLHQNVSHIKNFFFRYISLDNGKCINRNVDSLINICPFLFHLKNKENNPLINFNFKLKKSY